MIGHIGEYLLLEERYRARYSSIFEEIVYRVEPSLGKKEDFSLELLLLKGENLLDDEFLRMFVDEERICTWVKHPGFQRLVDIGLWQGQVYRVVEELSGISLSTLCEHAKRQEKKLSLGLICFVGMKLCECLSFLHNLSASDGQPLGFVYRRLATERVFLSAEGQVKLESVSLGKLYPHDLVEGADNPRPPSLKWKSLAPEAIRGLPVDARVDLFALGVCLFELWAGEPVFAGDTDLGYLRAVLEEAPRTPSSLREGLPKEVNALILHLLEKDPEKRLSSLEQARLCLANQASDAVEVGKEFKQILSIGGA